MKDIPGKVWKETVLAYFKDVSSIHQVQLRKPLVGIRSLHGPGPQPDPAQGPGLVAQIMFGYGPGSGLFQVIVLKRYIEHFGLSQAIIFSQRRSCAHLMLVTLSGSGNKSHRLDFFGNFCSCPSQN
jgi:hypothetical protein